MDARRKLLGRPKPGRALRDYNCCPGAGANLRLVERFTRVGANTLDHRYTVEDPTTYTGPWTASIPLARFDGPIYEYACHEGNYGMENLLRGARVQEQVDTRPGGSR